MSVTRSLCQPQPLCATQTCWGSLYLIICFPSPPPPPPRPQFHGGERYITHSHIPDTPGLRKGAQQKWQIKGLATPLASSAPPVMDRRQAQAPWPKTECLNGSTESSTRAPGELESESQTHPINTQNLAGFYKVTLQSMTKTTRTLKVQISLSFF